ncbi:PREDICTED: elongator complex protein 6 [Vollenhovia emeryi]|uniref:elongator complex protein 6 n=1 Tax=Vollenhovia emeryi TaxID=411798 RepID=UPI0005F391C5|nr:PREDICTED: elongator complex protein 6 [Vollenhovia emeryi]XP_011874276.1 PREDICTED: elongator complex protein 6 [Vollenhovia emeryi]
MASSMETVCNILGIDRVNMDGKTILIEEQHGTNANFLVNAILSHTLKKMNAAVCLVLCHNTFSHYHNIGMRFGYNLLDLKDNGQITVVEPMKIIASNVTDICNDFVDRTETIIPEVTSMKRIDIVHRLFSCVKEKYEEAARFTAHKSVVLIIDDINHFLDLGLSVRDTMYFIRYLRSFVVLYPTSQLCILAHVYQGNMQTSDADTVANALKHMAHLCVTTQPFKTGHSSDASGKLTVCWKTNSIKSKFHWAGKATHLFNLSDWQVKICAPGAMSVLS